MNLRMKEFLDELSENQTRSEVLYLNLMRQKDNIDCMFKENTLIGYEEVLGFKKLQIEMNNLIEQILFMHQCAS